MHLVSEEEKPAEVKAPTALDKIREEYAQAAYQYGNLRYKMRVDVESAKELFKKMKNINRKASKLMAADQAKQQPTSEEKTDGSVPEVSQN